MKGIEGKTSGVTFWNNTLSQKDMETIHKKVMGVKAYLKKEYEDLFCNDCYGNLKGEILCTLCNTRETFTQITAAEFNASTGKKYRVKKDGRVLPYEDDSAEIIIIMDDKK